MDIIEKYHRLDTIKEKILKMKIESEEYKLVINETEIFLRHVFDNSIAESWINKIQAICWHPRVYSIGGDDSLLIRNAWVGGAKEFVGILDAIRIELSYEDVCESPSIGSLVSVFVQHLDVIQEKMIREIPESHDLLISINNNVASSNPEDWSNATGSCRRLLKCLADSIYPPINEKRFINGKERDLGEEQYINRLLAYISECDLGETYSNVLVSDINRTSSELDALLRADCKGVHGIVSLDEVRSYVIRTIIIVGDILSI